MIFGCVAQPAEAANVARVIALRAGVPNEVPAVTVHRNCASGMEAITTAQQRMMAGLGDLFLVGGAESMSRIPLFYSHKMSEKFGRLARAKSLPKKFSALASFRPRDFSPRIGLQLGLTDPVSGMIMGDTAELLAREYGITREMQDAFAAESHLKALAAREQLNAEIAPVPVHGKSIASDNGLRDDSTPERLARLRPIFDRKTGSVTAGNSSQITDGAVALLVGSEDAAKRLGLEPLGRLVSYAYAGCDPARMGLGPVNAMALAKARCGLGPEDADLVELNEAFARAGPRRPRRASRSRAMWSRGIAGGHRGGTTQPSRWIHRAGASGGRDGGPPCSHCPGSTPPDWRASCPCHPLCGWRTGRRALARTTLKPCRISTSTS